MLMDLMVITQCDSYKYFDNIYIYILFFFITIDIIVGAPWEEYGVIYVYNGGSDLKDRSLQASQRIDVTKFSQFNRPQKIQRFGFSMSKPVDIDENGLV